MNLSEEKLNNIGMPDMGISGILIHIVQGNGCSVGGFGDKEQMR